MRTTFIPLILAGALLQTSCNSFNRTWVVTVPSTSGPPTSVSVTNPPASECPMFVLPKVGDIPELPYAELKAAEDTHDPREVNRVIKDHIVALRNHILSTQYQINDAYTKYLDQCHLQGVKK